MGTEVTPIQITLQLNLNNKNHFSLVDPQGTDYCLVVSKDRHYKTLCSALDDVPEGPKPKMYRRHAEIGALQQKITAWDSNQKRGI